MDHYRVVYNHEEQYSIWPVWKDDPPGWTREGTTGTKEFCLNRIEEIWVDMRPLSLRKFMEENNIDPDRKIVVPEFEDDGVDHFNKVQEPNELVLRLLEEQPVKIIRYRDRENQPDLHKLKKAIEVGYVLVKFTETQGGTEIGANVNNDDSSCYARIEGNELMVRGRLILDFTPVVLTACVSVDTFEGTGKLEVVQDWR